MPLTTSCSCCRLLCVLPSHGIFHQCCLVPCACLAGQDHRAPGTSPSSHPYSLQMLKPHKTFFSPLPSAHRKLKKGFSSLPQAADEDLTGQNYKPALKYQNSSQPLRAGQPRSESCSFHIQPGPFLSSSLPTQPLFRKLQSLAEGKKLSLLQTK